LSLSFSLTKEQITMLIGEIEVIINIGARYNIAPTQIVAAIQAQRPGGLKRWTCNGVSNRRGANSRSSTPNRISTPRRQTGFKSPRIAPLLK